ncbi:MAG: protein kinase [Gemmataceae bacterium]|nr:protein kinase [Gemmataceae bacterium]
MSNPTGSRDPFDKVAEAFLERYRHGERPSVTEYVEKHPELAEQIRDLFPALVEMEELRPRAQPATGPFLVPADADNPLPAQLGEYRILREVGRGGMGIVYEAVQESLGRHVALKVLPPAAGLHPTYLERFRREATAAARLHHTNIVPVHGVGEQDGLHYYAMQFIQGQGLDVVLHEVRRLRDAPGAASRGTDVSASLANGLLTGRFAGPQAEAAPRTIPAVEEPPSAVPLPRRASSMPLPGAGESDSGLSAQPEARYVRSVARLGIQAAEALAYAHGQGTWHRDIKPSNLLLDTQGTLWLTDFGLAKLADSDDLTGTGDIVGTLRYLAPERFQGQTDARSDVYSLGLTLYELATLRPAFPEADRNRLLDRVKHAEPPRPRQLNPAIPRDLETIVLKAIAKEPAHRYPTAAALAEDLKRFVEDRPIWARRISSAERLWRWCRRNPIVAGLTAAVAGALLVGTLVSSHFAIQADHRAEEARANLYVARMNLAQAYWEKKGHGDRARELLGHYQDPPAGGAMDLRGWEWYYQWRLCHQELRTLPSDTAGVADVALSPDWRHLVTVGGDQAVTVWDMATGQPLRPLQGDTNHVRSSTFSPDGTLLAAVGSDQAVKVWDIGTGAVLRTLPAEMAVVSSVAFSQDGKWLAAARQDQVVKVWNLATGQELRTLRGPTAAVAVVAFSPDGRRLASGSGMAHPAAALPSVALHVPIPEKPGEVKVWNLATGQELLTLRGHRAEITSVAFSPDGKRLASASGDRTVMVWDLATGREPCTLPGHTAAVTSVAFSPDGGRLASAGQNGTVKVWDAATGQELGTRETLTAGLRSVAFSPEGGRLATIGMDQKVKVWDAGAGLEARTLTGHTGEVWNVAFSPVGGLLASASSGYDKLRQGELGEVKIWDVATGQELRTLPGHKAAVTSVAFSPDGKRLAAGTRVFVRSREDLPAEVEVKVWEVATGEVLQTLKVQSARVTSLAFSPDRRWLGAAALNGEVKVWDAVTGQEHLSLFSRNLTPQEAARDFTPFGKPLSMAFSPDGKHVASGELQGMVHIWDVTTGQKRRPLQAHPSKIETVAFSPDGTRLASAGIDGVVKVWDLASERELYTLRGHTAAVSSVAFHPDGTRLVSASGRVSKPLDGLLRPGEGEVKVWDLTTGQELRTLQGHPAGIYSVAFSPDGHRLAAAGADRKVRVWDARPTTPEARADDEALSLVACLFAKRLRRADVLARLRHDPTISEEVRQRALTLAERYREEPAPKQDGGPK